MTTAVYVEGLNVGQQLARIHASQTGVQVPDIEPVQIVGTHREECSQCGDSRYMLPADARPCTPGHCFTRVARRLGGLEVPEGTEAAIGELAPAVAA